MKPIIVIAYDDNVRKSLVSSLIPFEVPSVACATFCEAENMMLTDLFQGIIVDLTTMIKAKGEEKVVACSLTGFFPTLRVKAMGSMIIPISMAGEAKQDKSLSDFLKKTCSAFTPRKLRAHKRREIFLSTIINSGSENGIVRSCTLNVSWGGMFIITMNPEIYAVDQELSINIPKLEIQLNVKVVRVISWGESKAPGIGVKFTGIDTDQEQIFTSLLGSNRETDRDRLH